MKRFEGEIKLAREEVNRGIYSFLFKVFLLLFSSPNNVLLIIGLVFLLDLKYFIFKKKKNSNVSYVFQSNVYTIFFSERGRVGGFE